MSHLFAVVHEAEADFQTATELADRVLVEAIDWLDDDLLDGQRRWVEMVPVERRLTWKAIKQLAREAGIQAHGHFDADTGEREAGLIDAAAARRAILYLRHAFPDLSAVVLIRDQDNQPERRGGLEQARDNDRSGIVIVIGLAVMERECWVISGFDPQDDEESGRLEEERQTLGCDPRLHSHELMAGNDDYAPRSPKRVLRNLCGNNRGRERQCWTNTPLDRLRERGGVNGLAAYLGDVRERLAPLIGHVAEG